MIVKKLGFLIRINRELSHKSLREVANAVGISHVQLIRYEKGQDEFTKEKFENICNVLNINFIDDEEINQKLEIIIREFLNQIFYSTLEINTYLEELEKEKMFFYQLCIVIGLF